MAIKKKKRLLILMAVLTALFAYKVHIAKKNLKQAAMPPKKKVARAKTSSAPPRKDIKMLLNVKSYQKRCDGMTKSQKGRIIYKSRLKGISCLGDSPTEEERKTYYDFLRNDENDRQTLHVKDEIMCSLERQGKNIKEYVDELIDISMDKKLDGDLRGYAVQHLRWIYSKADSECKSKICETLYRGLDERDSAVAGTSLLALVNLSKSNEGFNEQEISDAALELAMDDSLHVPSRITAVRLCGELNLGNSVDIARSLVEGSTDKTMQLAAVATLGDVGDRSDLLLLERMRKVKPFKKASELSIRKIRKRF